MANLPVRLSEMMPFETPDVGRNSRRSKIPVGDVAKKRSLSTDPMSNAKVKVLPPPSMSSYLQRSKSTLSSYGTPAATPMSIQKSARKFTPRSQVKSNISEKSARLNEEMNVLCQYLTKQNLNVPNGTLKQISVSHFILYIQHFANLLTANRIRITMSNYIEELPKMMKSFKYTGQLSRSILIAPSTMHSWPHTLGLLVWFRIICNQLFLTEICYSLNEIENEKIKSRVDYIFKVFGVWYENEHFNLDEALDEYVNKLNTPESSQDEEDILAKISQNTKKLEELQKILEQKQTHYDEIRKEKESFAIVKKSVTDLEDKLQKLSEQCTLMGENNATARKKNESLLEEKKSLLLRIKEQSMSKDQKTKIESQIYDYNRNISKNREINQKHIESNYEIDVKLTALNSDIDKLIVSYKSSILNLYEKLTLFRIKFNADMLEITFDSAQSDDEINKILVDKLNALQSFSVILQNELLRRKEKYTEHLIKIEQMKDFVVKLQKDVDQIHYENNSTKKEIDVVLRNIQNLNELYEDKKRRYENIILDNKNNRDKNKICQIYATESVQGMIKLKETVLQLKEKLKQLVQNKKEFLVKEAEEINLNLTGFLNVIVNLNNDQEDFFKLFINQN